MGCEQSTDASASSTTTASRNRSPERPVNPHLRYRTVLATNHSRHFLSSPTMCPSTRRPSSEPNSSKTTASPDYLANSGGPSSPKSSGALSSGSLNNLRDGGGGSGTVGLSSGGGASSSHQGPTPATASLLVTPNHKPSSAGQPATSSNDPTSRLDEEDLTAVDLEFGVTSSSATPKPISSLPLQHLKGTNTSSSNNNNISPHQSSNNPMTPTSSAQAVPTLNNNSILSATSNTLKSPDPSTGRTQGPSGSAYNGGRHQHPHHGSFLSAAPYIPPRKRTVGQPGGCADDDDEDDEDDLSGFNYSQSLASSDGVGCGGTLLRPTGRDSATDHTSHNNHSASQQDFEPMSRRDSSGLLVSPALRNFALARNSAQGSQRRQPQQSSQQQHPSSMSQQQRLAAMNKFANMPLYGDIAEVEDVDDDDDDG